MAGIYTNKTGKTAKRVAAKMVKRKGMGKKAAAKFGRVAARRGSRSRR